MTNPTPPTFPERIDEAFNILLAPSKPSYPGSLAKKKADAKAALLQSVEKLVHSAKPIINRTSLLASGGSVTDCETVLNAYEANLTERICPNETN